MKRIISVLLALVLILSLSVTAFAAGDGTITINGVSAGTTYKIYKLLDLESYSGTAYSYKVNTAWDGFFDTAEALTYVGIDSAGYVTWKADEGEATVAAFAKLALQYAKDNGITAVAEYVGEDPAPASYPFTGLELGWYLVDSTAGALCALTTTNPNASVNAKNQTPTVDKQVQEDLTNDWGDSNSADIGQIVNFRTTIHVTPGAENYVLHDKMSTGLTFEHNGSDKGVTQIKRNSDGTETFLTEGTDYTVTVPGTDGCTFHVVFTDTLMNTIKPNDRIIVYYNAVLNKDAVIAGTGNLNESWLEYGEDHTTTHDKTQTYTYSFDIVKTDSSHKLIDGAEFRIYDAATGGNEIHVVKIDDATYRRAAEGETGVAIVVKDGKVTVKGFDNGTYYLEETESPDGYNKLTNRQAFTIADANLSAIFNDGVYSSGSGVHVVNKTGNMLPETGAMGTALFITFGMIVALGTGLLLVTKKRMGMIRE